MRIALVGTRGVPARYGGFETAAEEIGKRLVQRGHDVVVYCRNEGQTITAYLGMELVNLPALRVKAGETLSHTALSALHLTRHGCDAAIVFNAANAPFLPILKARGIRVALHMDGLEWARGKWGRLGRKYYLACERLGVRLADALIADARGIQNYYRLNYQADTVYIAYGAPILEGLGDDRLQELDLASRDYHLVVARFEPENNVDMIIDGYIASRAERPLVIVGSAAYGSEHQTAIDRRASFDDRVRLVGSIYDQELLNQLYANAFTYLHGHSVGGTNPSLLRAMGAGAAVNAIDVPFNREVLGDTGQFFRSRADVARLIADVESDERATRHRGDFAQERVKRLYDWDVVTTGYERLCERLGGLRDLEVDVTDAGIWEPSDNVLSVTS